MPDVLKSGSQYWQPGVAKPRRNSKTEPPSFVRHTAYASNPVSLDLCFRRCQPNFRSWFRIALLLHTMRAHTNAEQRVMVPSFSHGSSPCQPVLRETKGPECGCHGPLSRPPAVVESL